MKKQSLLFIFISASLILCSGCGSAVYDYANPATASLLSLSIYSSGMTEVSPGGNPSVPGGESAAYTATGNVTHEDAGLEGITMILNSSSLEESIIIQTDSNGKYAFSDLEDGQTYRIYPHGKNYSFAPFREFRIVSGKNLQDLNFTATVSSKDILDQSGSGGRYTINNIMQLEYLSGFKTLQGDLEINGALMGTMEGLRSLKRINGDLQIYGNICLKNLDGLNGLEVIDGTLEIYSNNYLNGSGGLKNLDGLEKLTTINGDLQIYGNLHLRNLDGLKSLTHVAGDIHITVNPAYISSEDVLDLVNGLTDFEGRAVYNEVVEIN